MKYDVIIVGTDIVVFDPNTVKSPATLQQLKQFPVGIE
jgi:hypothetical protein